MRTNTHYLQRGREAIGLRRADLARDIGMSPRTLQSWELGRTTPSAARQATWTAVLLEAADLAAERVTTPTPADVAAERRAVRRHRGHENARTLELARAIHDHFYDDARDRAYLDYRAFSRHAFLYAYGYTGDYPFLVRMRAKTREQDDPQGDPRPLTPGEIRGVLACAGRDNSED